MPGLGDAGQPGELSRAAARRPVAAAALSDLQHRKCRASTLLLDRTLSTHEPSLATITEMVRQCQTSFERTVRAVGAAVRGALVRCLGASNRSSAQPRSCGCSRGARDGSGSRSWPVSWASRRAPCTGSCRTLQAVGFVEQDHESGKYQLGPALLHMGSSYLDGNELRTRALNWADGLATRSGESVRIGTLHEQPGADRPPRVPARRQPPGARGRQPACRRTRPRSARRCSRTTTTSPATLADNAADRASPPPP